MSLSELVGGSELGRVESLLTLAGVGWGTYATLASGGP